MRLIRPAIALFAALAIVLTITAGSVSAGGLHARVFLLHLTGDQEATADLRPAHCVRRSRRRRPAWSSLVLPRQDVVCFVTKWRDIDGTVVAAHIHPAPVGVPGPVAVPLFSGTFDGTDRARGCVSGAGWRGRHRGQPVGLLREHPQLGLPGRSGSRPARLTPS